MTLDEAKDALAAAFTEYFKSALQRVTDTELEKLTKLARKSALYAALAAQGNEEAKDILKDLEAQAIMIAATAVVREGQELDKVLRGALDLASTFLAELIKVGLKVAA